MGTVSKLAVRSKLPEATLHCQSLTCLVPESDLVEEVERGGGWDVVEDNRGADLAHSGYGGARSARDALRADALLGPSIK